MNEYYRLATTILIAAAEQAPMDDITYGHMAAHAVAIWPYVD